MTSTVAPSRGDELFARMDALARQLRVDSIRASTSAGSGHPTSSVSAADLMAVLLTRHFRYDWDDPRNPANDHLVLSKGHASPLLYAMFKAVGVIDDEELMQTYRRAGARLQGHPTPALPWVDVATGSLGQGLPDAVGIALAGKYLDRLRYRVWVLCGDSEMAEGSMWEALDHAAFYRLGRLIAIVDVNRLGQRGPTELGWDLEAYRRRVEAFGCRGVVVDGHDLRAIDAALSEVRARDDAIPTVVLARTVKGKGIPEVENAEGWHGRPLPPDLAARAVAALGGDRGVRVEGPRPGPVPSAARSGRPAPVVRLPRYELGADVATRKAYGDALVALGARPEVVALDAEVGNSTHAELFKQAYPDRFFEMFIAEQQLVAAATGLAVRGYVPFASTFAAFFTRAFDFVRMAGVSGSRIRLVGSHAGVEIGPDGPSQMGLEDLAAMRAVHGSTVLYPCDAPSTAQLVQAMADVDGVAYLRTTRDATPVIYRPDEEFPVPGAKVLGGAPDRHVALLGAGVTLHECIAAADRLRAQGIRAEVVDVYSVKPIAEDVLERVVADSGGRLVVVEDHYPEGGLGAAVMEALARIRLTPRVAHLAVRDRPGSGSPEELLAAAGIDAASIVEAARALVP